MTNEQQKAIGALKAYIKDGELDAEELYYIWKESAEELSISNKTAYKCFYGARIAVEEYLYNPEKNADALDIALKQLELLEGMLG